MTELCPVHLSFMKITAVDTNLFYGQMIVFVVHLVYLLDSTHHVLFEQPARRGWCSQVVFTGIYETVSTLLLEVDLWMIFKTQWFYSSGCSITSNSRTYLFSLEVVDLLTGVAAFVKRIENRKCATRPAPESRPVSVVWLSRIFVVLLPTLPQLAVWSVRAICALQDVGCYENLTIHSADWILTCQLWTQRAKWFIVEIVSVFS